MGETAARKVARPQVHVLCEQLVCASCPAPVDHETCQQGVDRVFHEVEDLKLSSGLQAKEVVVLHVLMALAFFHDDLLCHFSEHVFGLLHAWARSPLRSELGPVPDRV